MDSARPFRAFVSYCHADKTFAAWLQRKLEAYRLPKRLTDKVAPLPGQAPGRIGPIFRDREDLSAATDLSAAVREAIAASSALVVVASPDAAKSHWVAREIALFRELHPEAPVLVALARGEPAEAMPEALRTGPEPLAADFRKQGDGKRLAFLKIVAGLSGLPLDALVQRDAQRQMRRVTAVTVGTSVLVLIMALLLVLALRAQDEAERQRAEAEHQRAEAEGLVEYMLTDLRERLRGVGRIDVMAAVNDRAMDHYSKQGDLTRLPDESLERRARILHAMGEDEEKRGDLDKALAQFNEAHRTTAAILARHPKDGDAIFAHAQSEFWVGYAAWRKDDRATTVQHWQNYLEQARALAAVEPGSVRSLMEQGYARGNLCDVDHRDQRDLRRAAGHCAEAVRLQAAALAKTPGDRKIMQDLANRHGWMARVHVAQRDFAGALDSRMSEIRILERLAALDPKNAEYAMRRRWADIGMSRILIELGRAPEAVALLERNWLGFEPQMMRSASNQSWETGLRILLLLAKAQQSAGMPAHRATQARADMLIKRYVAMFPNRTKQIRELRTDIQR